MTPQEQCRALAERLGLATLATPATRSRFRYHGRLIDIGPCPDFAFAVLEELARQFREGKKPQQWRVIQNVAEAMVGALWAGRDPKIAIINAACAALGIE